VILEAAEGITVVAEAANGVQAVAAVAAHEPDVVLMDVLMDVRMPEMDGWRQPGSPPGVRRAWSRK
jgi:YesN/AraC family two-component response regulator